MPQQVPVERVVPVVRLRAALALARPVVRVEQAVRWR